VLSRARGPDDEGQITLLLIGYAAVAVVLVVVGVDVSAVFLARRALASTADAAALDAARAVDRTAVYAGAVGGCGTALPLDAEAARVRADDVVADDAGDLRTAFRRLAPADVTVAGGTVTVHLSGRAKVPFGRLLAALLPGHDDGAVDIDVTTHARSPVTAAGC
jgi:uncharacterized membrane protein